MGHLVMGHRNRLVQIYYSVFGMDFDNNARSLTSFFIYLAYTIAYAKLEENEWAMQEINLFTKVKWFKTLNK
jgi:hypothetical protein